MLANSQGDRGETSAQIVSRKIVISGSGVDMWGRDDTGRSWRFAEMKNVLDPETINIRGIDVRTARGTEHGEAAWYTDSGFHVMTITGKGLTRAARSYAKGHGRYKGYELVFGETGVVLCVWVEKDGKMDNVRVAFA